MLYRYAGRRGPIVILRKVRGIDSGGFRVLKCSCWVSTTVQRLVGFHATGGSIASVTAGNMSDNSRFNKRPMLGPISKVEKCARQDDDAFAVVSVSLP